jgi:hypothetical protein
MTVTTKGDPTPTGTVTAPGYTMVSRGWTIDNGAVISSIGAYSDSAQSCSVKIVRRDGSGNYTVLRTETFYHLGGGWYDHPLVSPYTVPSAGTFHAACYFPDSVKTNPTTPRAYHVPPGNVGAGSSASWDEDNDNNCRALRVTGEGLSGGGETPPGGDGVWRQKTAGAETYWERAIGTPTTLVVVLHQWGGDLGFVRGYSGFEAVPNCVLIGPNGGGPADDPGTFGSAARNALYKAAIDQAKADWPGVTKTILIGVSGGGGDGLNLMAAYPGIAQGASLWMGIYDLAAWWAEYPGNRLEMEGVCGGTPLTSPAEYMKRSPRWTMDAIRDCEVIINSASGDTVVPPTHQVATFRRLLGLPGVDATFNDIGGGHRWDGTLTAAAVAQVAYFLV